SCRGWTAARSRAVVAWRACPIAQCGPASTARPSVARCGTRSSMRSTASASTTGSSHSMMAASPDTARSPSSCHSGGAALDVTVVDLDGNGLIHKLQRHDELVPARSDACQEALRAHEGTAHDFDAVADREIGMRRGVEGAREHHPQRLDLLLGDGAG